MKTLSTLAARAARISSESTMSAADADVESPCVSLCKMDTASGYCQGCFRSLDEIVAWSRLNGAGKRRVWGEILIRTTQRQVSP